MKSEVTTTIDGKTMTAEEFYEQARHWAAIVRNQAKRNAASFNKGKESTSHTYKKGKKTGKMEKKLTQSIQFKIEHDAHVPECVSFKIPIHGIYREWAVGKGQPRVPGKYVNPRPKIRRTMADWLDDPIAYNAENLIDIATEFYGDQVLINAFGTKK